MPQTDLQRYSRWRQKAYNTHSVFSADYFALYFLLKVCCDVQVVEMKHLHCDNLSVQFMLKVLVLLAKTFLIKAWQAKQLRGNSLEAKKQGRYTASVSICCVVL